MADKVEETTTRDDFSGGVQVKTSRFLKKANELDDGQNVSYAEVGSLGKSQGYIQRGSDLTSTTTTSTSTSTTTTSTSTSTSTTTTSTSTTTTSTSSSTSTSTSTS